MDNEGSCLKEGPSLDTALETVPCRLALAGKRYKHCRMTGVLHLIGKYAVGHGSTNSDIRAAFRSCRFP